MRRSFFLIAMLFALSFFNETVSAQQAFTPISKDAYNIYGKFFDKNFDESADVNFLISQSVMSPDIPVSVVLRKRTVKVVSTLLSSTFTRRLRLRLPSRLQLSQLSN